MQEDVAVELVENLLTLNEAETLSVVEAFYHTREGALAEALQLRRRFIPEILQWTVDLHAQGLRPIVEHFHLFVFKKFCILALQHYEGFHFLDNANSS